MRFIFAIVSVFALLIILVGCRQQTQNIVSVPGQPASTALAAPAQKEGEHVAQHGGCLNAVVTCENGHAEIKVNGDTLHCWFVGGGANTGASIPIGDIAITLTVKPAGGGGQRKLTLRAKPLKLAEETAGHCSYFEGKAAWLAGMSTFVADGTLHQYKGKSMPLHIEYPKGYDPD